MLAVVMPSEGDPPADEARLAERAEAGGADALFLPPPEALRPADAVLELRLPGLTDVLCGEDRPEQLSHFALAMARLLNQSQADVVMMGELDWQRLAILRRTATDLGLVTTVSAAPTARDDAGLALGAAEALPEPGRKPAERLWRELSRAAAAIAQGAEPDPTLDAAADALADAGAEVEYLEMRDAETLAELDAPDSPGGARLFAAITAGGVRLVDNVAVEPASPL